MFVQLLLCCPLLPDALNTLRAEFKQGEALETGLKSGLVHSSRANFRTFPMQSHNPHLMEEESEAEGKEVSCLNNTTSQQNDEEQGSCPQSFNPVLFPLTQFIFKFQIRVLS